MKYLCGLSFIFLLIIPIFGICQEKDAVFHWSGLIPNYFKVSLLSGDINSSKIKDSKEFQIAWTAWRSGFYLKPAFSYFPKIGTISDSFRVADWQLMIGYRFDITYLLPLNLYAGYEHPYYIKNLRNPNDKVNHDKFSYWKYGINLNFRLSNNINFGINYDVRLNANNNYNTKINAIGINLIIFKGVKYI